MPTTFNFSIPTSAGSQDFALEGGTSLLFVGANGCGKTRLAVKIEKDLALKAHRISAHRALTLKTSIAKISEEEALRGLRFGRTDKNSTLVHREHQRWSQNSSVSLLNDYDRLLQALFAEQTNKALESHKKVRRGNTTPAEATKFEKLTEIWERLIPHRKLEITGDDIKVLAVGGTSYPAEEMSDGERAIFYLIGQTLCAEDDSVLIFDEPELHIHKSIMSSLWDELESARTDCAFIFISHDLEFVASRIGQKYIIREYDPAGNWTIEDVPETGFSEEITTTILGSRRPILFVEGTDSSLDFAIYRNCYPEWTVIPRGACEDVIHSVVTMRNNASLTRITCSGIVDADDYSTEEIAYLDTLGIKVLPVSEIENLLLLPDIAEAIGRHEGHDDPALNTKLQEMNNAVIADIQQANNIEKNVTQYCRRCIDRILKKIDLSDAATVAEVATKYAAETTSLDVQAIAAARREAINNCITNQDIHGLMALYDNKGLVALAAKHLKATRKTDFENWIIRVLGNNSVPEITQAFRDALPEIVPS